MTTKFIKVTEIMSGGEEKSLLINAAHISHVQGGLNGKNTHIRMVQVNKDGHMIYYFVKESAEEIWKQLGDVVSKSPVMAVAEKYAKY